MTDLQQTGLAEWHRDNGGKMVPFAGYEMPVQYAPGVLKEHLHCRASAGLFDVGHMGQVRITAADGNYETAARALEALIPMDVLGLGDGRQRYGLFTNDVGGIEDDLMFARMGEALMLVVNAACKEADIARLQGGMTDCEVEVLDRGLIALQGPLAHDILPGGHPMRDMRFMDMIETELFGAAVTVSRSGYTGEDGYEISVAQEDVVGLWSKLCADERVMPIGLGARDSLRLEAGLCLYGSDLDPTTTPVEATLNWAIQKIRRSGGARAGGFPGAEVILAQLDHGADRRRVGLLPEGRAPMRGGTALYMDDTGGTPIGQITSGGFGPSCAAPVAMGYVPTAQASPDTQIFAELRGKYLPVKIAAMPFITPGYKR